MSWTGNYVCTSFKKELLEALHDFTAHTFRVALYDEDATLNAATADYSTTNEVIGTNYTAGGDILTPVAPTSADTVGYTSFQNYTFSSVTLSARGALIYNTTAGGGAGTTNAVIVLDFGRLITKTAQDLLIEFPTVDSLNSIIRVQ